MSVKGNIERRSRRKRYIRRKVNGSAERPRLTVSRSLKHIYVQAIDDWSGQTLAYASSLNDDLVTSLLQAGEEKGKTGMGTAVGKAIAQRLKEKNITTVIFDRNGYLYHGRVKAVADGIREGGLQM